MDFTQEQITEILSEFSSKKENGYQGRFKSQMRHSHNFCL